MRNVPLTSQLRHTFQGMHVASWRLEAGATRQAPTIVDGVRSEFHLGPGDPYWTKRKQHLPFPCFKTIQRRPSPPGYLFLFSLSSST